MCMQKFTDGQIVSKVLCCSEISSLTFSVFWRDAERMLHWHWYSNYQRASYATQHIPFYVLSYCMNSKINQPEPQGEHLPCYVIVMHCLCHWGTLSVKASILRCPVQPILLLSSAEFMPVGSEREEELQETRCVPQLETRLQHGSEHVRPAQVRTLAGQFSQSLLSVGLECRWVVCKRF